jgi:uncharacterized membrane protein
MRQAFFDKAKSIAGIILIGMGGVFFHQSLDRAIVRLSKLCGANSEESLGRLQSFFLGALKASQSYACDPHQILRGLLESALLSIMPLLLVMLGMVLSFDLFVDYDGTISQ